LVYIITGLTAIFPGPNIDFAAAHGPRTCSHSECCYRTSFGCFSHRNECSVCGIFFASSAL